MKNTNDVKPNKINFPSLSLIRVLMALLVLFYHFGPFYLYKDNWLVDNIIFGSYRLSMFFALSGFLLTVKYANEFRESTDIISIISFIFKRFIRVAPLYYFMILLTVPHMQSPSIILSHLTFNQVYIPEIIFDHLPAAWSLAAEVAFYVVLPFILIVVMRLNFVKKNNIFIYIACYVFGCWYFYFIIDK